jgi:LemA protein
MVSTGWVLAGLLAAVLVWAVVVYNRLVQLRNRIANAFGQIDVQLKRRYDLIPNLVEVARRYLAHEAATLEAVVKARGVALGRRPPRAAHPPMPRPSVRWPMPRRRWAAAWVACWPWPRATPN